ncbi:MAG: class I SAM-dependent methyltransferase [bacterium]
MATENPAPQPRSHGDLAADALEGAMMLGVGYVGLFNGLFEELGANGPRTAPALAEKLGLDPGYTARWCESAYAFGLLDAEGDAFRLSPFAESALVEDSSDYRGGFFFRSVFASTIVAEQYARAMKTGERKGYGFMAPFGDFLKRFGAMMENVQKATFLEQILPAVPAYAEVGEAGGRVVDMGCANAWFLVLLAQRFPKLTGTAVDFVPANVEAARKSVERNGLSGRLEVFQNDIKGFEYPGKYDLVAMNQVVHDVWDDHELVLGKAYDALNPGGFLALWDRPIPPDRKDSRPTRMHFMMFLNLFEEMAGTSLLTHEEMVRGVKAAGFQEVQDHFVEGGSQVVVLGRKTA